MVALACAVVELSLLYFLVASDEVHPGCRRDCLVYQ